MMAVLSGVRNALRILDGVSQGSQILGVFEIARPLGLQELVSTLCSTGYLAATACGKYRLGLRLFDGGTPEPQYSSATENGGGIAPPPK